MITIPDTPPPPSTTNSNDEDDDVPPPPPQQHNQEPQVQVEQEQEEQEQQQHQHEILEQELNKTQDKLKDAESKCEASQKLLQETKQDQKALHNKYSSLLNEKNLLMAANMKMQWDLRVLNNTNANGYHGHVILCQAHEKLKQQCSNLSAAYDKLHADHNELLLNKTSNKNFQIYIELRETNENLQTKNEELTASYNKLLSTKEQLQISHLATTDAHALLQRDHQKLCMAHESLKKSYNVLKPSCDVAQEDNQTKATVAAVVPNATIAPTDIETKLRSQIEKLEQELTERRKECRDALETKRMLREERVELRDTKYKLHEEQTALHYLKASLQREQKRETNTFSSIQKEREEMRKERAALRSEKEELRREKATLHDADKKIQNERSQLQQTQIDLQCTQSALQTAEKNLEIAETNLVELKKELDCMEVMYEAVVQELKVKDDTMETIQTASDKKIKDTQLQIQQIIQERDDAIRTTKNMEIKFHDRDRIAVMYETVVKELKAKDDTIATIHADSDKRLNDIQLQMQRIIQERDDAIRLTEDMEIELHRLSDEVDFYEGQHQVQILPNRSIKKRKR